MQFDQKRRAVITLLGGGAVAWPLAVRAQQAGKTPTIGFLGSSTLSEASPWVSAFVERLRELGWTEGRNVAMAFRWAGGRTRMRCMSSPIRSRTPTEFASTRSRWARGCRQCSGLGMPPERQV
jgi:hypothetical protein